MQICVHGGNEVPNTETNALVSNLPRSLCRNNTKAPCVVGRHLQSVTAQTFTKKKVRKSVGH